MCKYIYKILIKWNENKIKAEFMYVYEIVMFFCPYKLQNQLYTTDL